MVNKFNDNNNTSRLLDLTDEDIFNAMKEFKAYIDITPGDFKLIYQYAHGIAIKRLQTNTKAKDIMTHDVISVSAEDSLQLCAEKMAINKISGVPVIDKDQKVKGIISENDFLKHMGSTEIKTFMDVIAECLRGSGCLAISIRKRIVSNIMTTPVITVYDDTTIVEIVKIFSDKNINRTPVVNQLGHLIGIVTRSDILQLPMLFPTCSL